MSSLGFENVYILSPLQQGLLYHTLLEPEAGLYVDQTVLDLAGEIDVEALAGALRYGVGRHPALRASFHWEEIEKPVQVVHRSVEVPLVVEDWRGETPERRGERLEAFLAADRRRGFDLARPPLLRYALIRTGERESLLVSTFHHILLDGWSSALLLSDLLYAYEELVRGRTPQPRPVRPFSDYIGWLRRQDGAAAEAFWRDRLAGLKAPTRLSFNFSADRNGRHRRAAENPFAGAVRDGGERHGERSVDIASETTAALRSFAARHGLTINTLVQGVWALLLHRYSGEPEVVFGATVAGRPESLPGVESIVGLFINTVPVRVRVSPGDELIPWLAEIQRRQVAAHPYEHSPLAEVQRWSGVAPGEPLFETLIAFESIPDAEAPEEMARPLTVCGSRYVSRTHYPLSLLVHPGERLSIQATYDRRRFDDDSVAHLLGQMAGLLARFVEEPSARVEHLSLLGPAERERLIREAAGPPAEPAPPLHVQIAAQAERLPDAVALAAESPDGREFHLTYGELVRRVRDLAAHLRSLGIGQEVPVVTAVERSPEAVVTLIGVLEAGGVYVPAEPEAPAERIAFLLADTGAPVRLGPHLPAPSPASPAPSPGEGEEKGLAYVIYTSGSTGEPKGVGVSHAVTASHMAAAARAYGIGPGDRVLQFTSFAFDAGLEQVFTALTCGATLVVRSSQVWDTAELSERLARLGVTVANFPTSYWGRWTEALAEAGAAAPLPPLRLMIAGGEAMLPEWVERWQTSPLGTVRLLNAYGPTEASITAAFEEVPRPFARRGAMVPIGRCTAGRAAYVLDPQLEPLPPGVPGELWLGGVLLARGYLGRPGLTAAAFVPDPFSDEPGARLYRTGDRVRALPDGRLEFLGRIDRQVKVRGFRIEPGEIEAVLERHPGVGEAAVELRTDLPSGPALVAYVAPARTATPFFSSPGGSGEGPGVRGFTGELRRFLAERLPSALVPGHFVVLDELPRTSGAKVDRRALSRLEVRADWRAGRHETAAPRNPVEALLAEIWQAVLGVERAGIDDDFLALGGHSLLAMRLLSRVREAFRVDLPLASLFEAPTVAGQAEHIAAVLRAGEQSAAPPLGPADRSGRLPLSFAQQRLWILEQLNPGLPAYNIPLALRLSGPLSDAALQHALTAVTARHEALRTRFGQREGEPEQIIESPPSAGRPVALPAIDLGALPSAPREAALLGICRAEAGWRFDFARGPLMRAALVRLGEAEHSLLVTVHHIVADGWSIGVLLRELAAFYREAAGGGPADLPPLPVQYADYAFWQRAWLQGEVLERQLAFWRERLAGAPAVLHLPIDRPRPALRTTNGARLPVSFGAELSAAVRRLARAARATPFMVLLAAFQELLGRVSGRQDVTVGTPVANRNRVEVEGLIGFFVNTLVLRAGARDGSGGPTVRERIERAREETLAAYAHQDVPFEKLVEELHPERSLAVTPLFQVLFTLESPPPPPRLPGLEAAPLEVESGVAKFDLSLALSDAAGDAAGDVAGALEYNVDLFDAATAARLAGHLRTLVAGFAARSDAPVAELPVLTGPERHQILAEWNDAVRTAASLVEEGTLHRLFARQAARTPKAVAVVFGGEPMTYAELDALSDRLAHRLRSLGVGPEVPVGVLMERTLEMVVAILGVLKAGGAYVPLDPAYPQERLSSTLADCRAPVVLTQEWLADHLPEDAGRPFLLDASWEALAGAPEEPPADLAVPGNLAYLIYTSGSTGRPKGVAIEHRSAAALLAWTGEAFSEAELASVLASTSICFDLSVFELFAPLARGGRVVLAESALDLMALGDTARVALVNTVPSAAAELARAGALPASVRTLNLAGEPIPAALVERLASQPGLERVWNLYGPSEATTYSTAYRVLPALAAGPERRSPPIGRPIAGTAVFVLDRLLRPVPIGVPGELYIAGDGLARGYFGRPDLTAASFLPHPWDEAAGSRVYRTGDLVRLLPDGNFEFLGRIDHQVKVRGFRIELEEVEAVLARHPAVAQAAAAVREDTTGDRRLVAYVAPRRAGEEPEPGELRAELQRSLPEFMVPSLFVALPALPLTANGKVDRAALPAPEAVRPKAVYVEPETALERAVAQVVATALGVERVGRHDNFFDLGGHSLLMIRAAGLIEQRLGQKLQVLELFRFPTVAALAAHLAAAAGIATAHEELPSREELEKRFETRRQGQERRRELRQNLR